MSDRFASRLATEAPRWVRDGLISAAQAERILARYRSGSGWLARPIVLFALIGGALIAAAIALVVAHNWHEIHRWAKLGALIIIMALFYAVGLRLRERGRPASAEGVLVLAGALVMVAIALIGQIYHLSGHPADAVMLWWVLLLPAAYTLPSIGLGLLAAGALVVWYALALMDRTTRLGAVVYDNPLGVVIAIVAFGMALFSAGILHGGGRYRRIGNLLETVGLLGMFGGLIPLTFLWRREVAPQSATPPAPMLWGLLAIALIVSVATWIAVPRDTQVARAGFLAVAVCVLLYLGALDVVRTSRAPAGFIPAMAFMSWALMFAVPLVLILYGARWRRPLWINGGVLVLGVHSVARFIDLFGTMLETSVLFFAAGVFVLALGWLLEHMRRRMAARAARAEAT